MTERATLPPIRPSCFYTSMAESTTSQAKDRQYAQLSKSVGRLSNALAQTAELFDELNSDLHAMRTLGATHASLCVSRLFDISMEADENDTERFMAAAATFEGGEEGKDGSD